MLSGVEDRLALLVRNAQELVDCGYYEERGGHARGRGERASLVKAIAGAGDFPIVAEVKLASPTAGRLGAHLAEELIDDYRLGGAAALSVLTEPRYFKGSFRYLELAARTGLPVMMKDFVIDPVQVDAAARAGASAVLLIEAVFDRELAVNRDELMERAHEAGLEVVLESSTLNELERAVESQADVLAFNRRDLHTFRRGTVGLDEALRRLGADDRPSMIMSMMDGREDVAEAMRLGASCVLIGSALSSSPCPKDKLLSMRVAR